MSMVKREKREMVKLSMKHVNDVKKLFNLKCASMQEMNKRQNKYLEKGDEKTQEGKEKIEKIMINQYQFNEGKSYLQ